VIGNEVAQSSGARIVKQEDPQQQQHVTARLAQCKLRHAQEERSSAVCGRQIHLNRGLTINLVCCLLHSQCDNAFEGA
jgi:hypothetical protein